jgi:hypothetical protein
MAEQEKANQGPSPAAAIVEENETSKPSSRKIKRERPEVVTVRSWREYLGESMLIVFSVVLALALTEWFTRLHEEAQTRQILHELRQELLNNKEAEEIQYHYHQKIMRRLDSALVTPEYAQKFISNGRVHLSVIIDSGVIRKDLDDVAWQIAKQNDIFSKLDLSTISLLNDIYDNQQRITTKLEDGIGNLMLSLDARKPENLKMTLILIQDNYFAWELQRAPSLLDKYERAIDKLKKYQ